MLHGLRTRNWRPVLVAFLVIVSLGAQPSLADARKSGPSKDPGSKASQPRSPSERHDTDDRAKKPQPPKASRHDDDDDEGSRSKDVPDCLIDKNIFFRTPLPDNQPCPFDPTKTTSVLFTHLAVRLIDALNPEVRHSGRDDDHGNRRTFAVRLVWTILDTTGAPLRTLETTFPLVPPYTVAKLQAPPNACADRHDDDDDEDHRPGGLKRYLLVDNSALAWDGQAGSGPCPRDGVVYKWTAQAFLIRQHGRGQQKSKVIGKTSIARGIVVTIGTKPVLTVSSPPTTGLITSSRTITVSGEASGQAPLALTLGGTPVPGFTGGTFSQPLTFPADGSFTVEEVVTDCAGRTSRQSQTVCIDGAPPVVMVDTPAASSMLNVNRPQIAVSYQTAQACNALDLASLQVLLNGATIGPFTAGANHAVFTPGTPLADGTHTLTSSIRSLAGVLGQSAAVSFLIDTVPPRLTIDAPAANEVLPSATPTFQVSFSDTGSGVQPSSFRATLDGSTDITSLFTLNASGATAQVPATSPLPAGPHQLAVSLSDKAANESSAQVSFSVAQPPPPPTAHSGRIVGQVVSGTVCNPVPIEGATVNLLHASGQTATTDAQGKFTLSAPAGLAWLQVDKPGAYLYVQRSVQVIEDQDVALPTVVLAAQDPKVSHVIAAIGGTISDSTGNAFMDIPAGALPEEEMDIVLTLVADLRASKGPPLQNLIPSATVRILPDRVTLNSAVTVRVRNSMSMPVHPINVFDFNPDTHVWERTGNAFIQPDGFFASFITHFSAAAPG